MLRWKPFPNHTKRSKNWKPFLYDSDFFVLSSSSSSSWRLGKQERFQIFQDHMNCCFRYGVVLLKVTCADEPSSHGRIEDHRFRWPVNSNCIQVTMIEIWNPKRSSLWTGDWWIISVEFSSVTLVFHGATKFPMDLKFQICARWRWFKFLKLHHHNIYGVAKQALSTRKILEIQCIFFCDFVKMFRFNFGRNFFFYKKKQ